VEDGERDLRHAAAVLHFYAHRAERGWHHQAVDYDFCLRAAARLQALDVDALTNRDRVLLRRVADVLVCAEPNAYELTARGLKRLAGPPGAAPHGEPPYI
jgi:hypothetical protein